MAIIYDLSSGTIQSDTSPEGDIEDRHTHPDDRPELQLALQEATSADTCSQPDPVHLVNELLKKL